MIRTEDLPNGSLTEPVVYAETRPPVLWTGKTKCGRVLICVDGSGRVKK